MASIQNARAVSKVDLSASSGRGWCFFMGVDKGLRQRGNWLSQLNHIISVDRG